MNEPSSTGPSPSPRGNDDGPPVYVPHAPPVSEPPLAASGPHLDSSGEGSAPAVDDGQPALFYDEPPLMAPVDPVTPAKNRSVRKTALWAAVTVAGALVLAGGAWLAMREQDGQGNDTDLVLYDDDGVYLVPPGEPIDRQRPVGAGGSMVEGMGLGGGLVVVEPDGYVGRALGRAGGRELLVMGDTDTREQVLVTTANGQEPEVLLSSAGPLLRVDVDEDRLRVKDDGLGERPTTCYSGEWDNVGDRPLFKGDDCLFSPSGRYLAGWDEYDEIYEVQIFDSDGSFQREFSARGRPIHLNNDGRLLVAYDDESSEVVMINTSDGTEVNRLEATDGDVSIVIVSDHMQAIGHTNHAGQAFITLFDDNGVTTTAFESADYIKVKSDGQQRLYWMEFDSDIYEPNDRYSRLFRWDFAADRAVELIGREEARDGMDFDLTPTGVAVSLSYRAYLSNDAEVVFIDADDNQTVLGKYPDAVIANLSANEEEIAVLIASYRSPDAPSGAWMAALLPIEGDDPVVYEHGVGIAWTARSTFHEDWLIVTQSTPTAIVAMHRDGRITELNLGPTVNPTYPDSAEFFFQVHDSVLYLNSNVTGPNYDVHAFDLDTGNPMTTIDYTGFRLFAPWQISRFTDMQLME